MVGIALFPFKSFHYQNLGFVLLPIWEFCIFPCVGFALFFQGWVLIMGNTEFPLSFTIMEIKNFFLCVVIHVSVPV